MIICTQIMTDSGEKKTKSSDLLYEGQFVDGYIVIEWIGEGTYAQVFKVSCEGNEYAMKVSKRDGLEELRTEDKIYTYLKTHQGLSHFPKLISGFTYLKDGHAYIVIELINGSCIHDNCMYVDNNVVERDLTLAVHTATQELERVSIYHGDIHGGNLLAQLCDGKYHVYILDFSEAQIIDVNLPTSKLLSLKDKWNGMLAVSQVGSRFPLKLSTLIEHYAPRDRLVMTTVDDKTGKEIVKKYNHYVGDVNNKDMDAYEELLTII